MNIAAPSSDSVASNLGTQVLGPSALLSTPVGGLERTRSTSSVVPITGTFFDRALRVVIGEASADTNATQLTITNVAPVEKGDVLLAEFSMRGTSAQKNEPAQAEFMFERATDPWTKSATQSVSAAPGNRWKRVQIPFVAGETYAPGEVMASLRLAFGPQTVEIGALSVQNFKKDRTVEELTTQAAVANPLGSQKVTANLRQTRQTLRGFGGNFAQPRYGRTEPLDAPGRYNLDNLRVVHARVGLPLDNWTPERGVYKDEAQARAALLQMQEMTRRKIPITLSVWEGPLWMLPGTRETGRALPPENYAACAEAIAQFMVTARDKYGAQAEYFSFNEPDYGVNFKLSPREMADFIRVAGPRFRALGLRTKFLTADTANGGSFADYARPLLEDRTIAPYLGPLAFHSWDALSAPDSKYLEIAEMGRKYKKPVWCTEAGHDAQLWQKPNPWASWENALRTALAYERTLRLTGAEQMDYWTYQDNYSLVSSEGVPHPVWKIVRQMEVALAPGYKVTQSTSGHADLKALVAVGLKPGQFSALLINTIGAGRVSLEGLPPRARVSISRSTSEAQSVAQVGARVDAAGRLTVAMPARSVVTVAAG